MKMVAKVIMPTKSAYEINAQRKKKSKNTNFRCCFYSRCCDNEKTLKDFKALTEN